MAAIVIDDIQLDPHINFGCKHTVSFVNVVIASETRVEQRFGRSSRSQRLYSFDDAKNREELLELKEFFEARRANLRGFRWRDWSEYLITDEVIDFVTATAQLSYTYTDAINPVTRDILKPIASTFVLKLDNVVINPADYTLDDATGLVTLDAPPVAGVYTFTTEFDVPARFLNQSFEFTQIDVGMFDVSGLMVIELLPGEVA